MIERCEVCDYEFCLCDERECYFCGFVKCACDELNDAYEAQMDMIYWGDK